MSFGLSFIIPYRENENISKTVENIKKCCINSKIPYEIFTASGNNPTVQRNKCIEKASYPYIYFLDNDSILIQSALDNLINLLKNDSQIAIIGGPAITPEDNSFLQKNIASLFSSFFAIGKISSRYSKKGVLRITSDIELILCNLIIRKDIFPIIGNFNEKLYPNEENELIYKAKEADLKVMYDPDIFILRDQRPSLKAFLKQLYNYGRGRGEQTKIDLKSFNLSLLFPILFTVYTLIIFPVIFICYLLDSLPQQYHQYTNLSLVPFFLYMIILVLSIFELIKNRVKLYITYPFFFILSHVSYGIGFFKGFFNKKLKAETKDIYFNIDPVSGSGGQ